MDLLLRYVQEEDAAHELTAAGTNPAITVDLLMVAHATAVAASDPAATELFTMIAERVSLHQHAAALAGAGQRGPLAADGGPRLPLR